MSIHQAHAYIELEIARIARSVSPAQDRTFIEGMIEMAAFLHQINQQEAECYREALAAKSGDRIVRLRSAA